MLIKFVAYRGRVGSSGSPEGLMDLEGSDETRWIFVEIMADYFIDASFFLTL